MKNTITKNLATILIGLSLLLYPCRSEQDIKLIREQKLIIEQYEQEAKKQQEEINSKTYLFMTIKFVKATKRIVPETRDPYTYQIQFPSYEIEDLDTVITISNVQTQADYNEDVEFQLLDEMQRDLKSECKYKNYYVKSILERKVYPFKTYKDASIALAKYTAQTEFIKM